MEGTVDAASIMYPVPDAILTETGRRYELYVNQLNVVCRGSAVYG